MSNNTENKDIKYNELYNEEAIDNIDESTSEILSDAIYNELEFEDDDDYEIDNSIVNNNTDIVDGYVALSKHVLNSEDFPKISLDFNTKDLLGLTKQEAMRVLNTNDPTKIYSLVRKGYIRYFEFDGVRRYYANDVYRLVNYKPKKINVIYVRSWQKTKLKTKRTMKKQIETLLEHASNKGVPIKRIYRDFAIGIDYSKKNRKGLYELLYDVIRHKVDKIYVYSPDRISPIGYDLVVQIFSLFGADIEFFTKRIVTMDDRYSVIGELNTLFKLYDNVSTYHHLVGGGVNLSKINYMKLLKGRFD